VAIEVRAVDVVDGATVVMAAPSMAERVGTSERRSLICCHPSPSMTRRTT
jgi:hypothetical protein